MYISTEINTFLYEISGQFFFFFRIQVLYTCDRAYAFDLSEPRLVIKIKPISFQRKSKGCIRD